MTLSHPSSQIQLKPLQKLCQYNKVNAKPSTILKMDAHNITAQIEECLRIETTTIYRKARNFISYFLKSNHLATARKLHEEKETGLA